MEEKLFRTKNTLTVKEITMLENETISLEAKMVEEYSWWKRGAPLAETLLVSVNTIIQ